MFLFVPVAIGLNYLLETFAEKRAMEVILSSFIILVLIGLGHSTFMRNFAWKNEKSLWIDAAEKSPKLSRPHHNLGKYYQDRGYDDKAIQEYHKALESPFVNRRDSLFVTYYNLGKIYAKRSDFKMAESYYDKAVNLNSHFSPLFNDMGALFDREGKPKVAHKYLLKALKLSPQDGFANFNLGFHYLQQGMPEKALNYLTKLPESEKSFGVRLPLYLGIAFKQTGRLGMAYVFLVKSIMQSPNNINAHIHLAEVLYAAGKKERAEKEATLTLNLIGERTHLENIFQDLTGNGRSQNLQPDGKIILPLMREVMLKKSKVLKKWAEELLEK